MNRAEVEAFIRANLPLAPALGLPDIALHLATPASGLHRLAQADPEGFASPYWAYAWGGGLALAHHLRTEPALASGRRVLDLGAGSGLVAIAAARAGAARVTAAETCPYGRVALALNAHANGCAVAVVGEDLLDGPAPDVDLVLVGDLFYAAELAARTSAFVERCAAAGVDVLIGDPGRPTLPLPRLERVAVHPVTDFGASDAGEAGVYRLRV